MQLGYAIFHSNLQSGILRASSIYIPSLYNLLLGIGITWIVIESYKKKIK